MIERKHIIKWGTYGKKGNLPLREVYLHERFVSHLRAILRQGNISQHHRDLIEDLIEDKLIAIGKRINMNLIEAYKFGLL